METQFNNPPRTFSVNNIEIQDNGKIILQSNEMISLKKISGRECDVTATSWGYYLGPSLNARLKRQGFKTALVLNELGNLYVNAVEPDKMSEFHNYLTDNNSRILCWLDEWIPKD